LKITPRGEVPQADSTIEMRRGAGGYPPDSLILLARWSRFGEVVSAAAVLQLSAASD
jgi:hypothetical protein